MASSAYSKLMCLSAAFLYLSALCCRAEYYYEEGPMEILERALRCFDDRVVYRECAYEYRLTADGYMTVPEASTEAFCSGPCLEETDMVLHCVDRILDHFEFYNRATIRDVRDTIRDACREGRWRGRFDVYEHMQAGKAVEPVNQLSHLPLLLGLSLMLLLQNSL
ncbi:uncharacterized protein LOC116261737 isoform X2 [Nymphaea colorata]|uniref:uncharacterized protein LOC116261737 isoform X2 n=1 Tax=Nymphaea colorata TaxID=210225 RepID=UPI00129DB8F0|nr:uncharacterized protein LOC116261737 isoform X2 [Nymphaea colorata]